MIMNEEKYHVLILDDDDELGDLLKEYIQKATESSVTVINSEADLWGLIRNESFDILFLDYKMPEANGLDILVKLGEQGYAIPTVMMTGEGSENVAARAIQAGAIDYLVKGEYAFTALPPLIQKAARLREMQRAMQVYLEQVRYQSMLLDNMRDAVVVWALDGTITYWNAAAEQLYNVPANERLGKRVEEIYFPAFDPPMALDDISQRGNIQMEHRCRLPGGETKWISAHISVLYSENGRTKPIGFMNIARDITPRKQEQEALQKSQNFIKRVLDTSPNIIYVMDLRKQEIHFVNAEVKDILVNQDDTFRSVSFSVIEMYIHPDDLPQLKQHVQDLYGLRDGTVLEVEYRIMPPKREWRWLHNRSTIFSLGKNGTPAEVIGVIEDITANKLAEQKLQRRLESERLLSTISNQFISHSPPEIDQEVSAALSLAARFIQVETGAALLLDDGLFPDRLPVVLPGKAPLQCPFNNLSAAEKQSLFEKAQKERVTVIHMTDSLVDSEKALLQSLELQSLVLAPLFFHNTTQGVLLFGTSKAGFQWSEDDIYVLRSLSEMITNALVQKQTDQALRKSEARYRAIVEEHQTEMICRFLPDSTLTFVNEAYCHYYRQERSSLIGASFMDPTMMDEQTSVREMLSGLSTSDPVAGFEQRVRLPTGEIRWQEWAARAIFDQNNDFMEFQAVGRDITARKNMENQIQAAQAHLAQTARLAAIGELASSVAHQISNPLTTIIAEAQILLHTLEKQHSDRESAEAIVQAGWRTQQVINELMKFSQPSRVMFEVVSVNETIQAALLLAEAHIEAQGALIVRELAPDLPIIRGNPRQLTDLWVSLLLLARTAFQDESKHHIWIKTYRSGICDLIVEIMDDGIPILPEQYDTIFEPQLIPAGVGRGTGIELSICREIVRQNRGRIGLSSQSGKTTFQITFTAEGT